MFPIPSHLPRMNGNDHTDQKKDSGASSSAQAPVEVEKDRVLDLFGPLLGDVSALSVRQAKGVRETFESAIQENKVGPWSYFLTPCKVANTLRGYLTICSSRTTLLSRAISARAARSEQI